MDMQILAQPHGQNLCKRSILRIINNLGELGSTLKVFKLQPESTVPSSEPKELNNDSRSVESAASLLQQNEILVFPLSFTQQRFWILDRLEPNSAAYNIPIPLHLSGTLNIEALEQALSEVVRRHEVLRATFELDNGSPAQI